MSWSNTPNTKGRSLSASFMISFRIGNTGPSFMEKKGNKSVPQFLVAATFKVTLDMYMAALNVICMDEYEQRRMGGSSL